MNQIQLQGLLFSLVAMLTALASRFFVPVDSMFSLIVIAALLFFLGVPHGALDPIFAQKLMGLSRWQSWLKFVLVYLILVGMTVIGWWQFPLFFMTVFLVLSIIHFSKDLAHTTPTVSRLLYGGAVIVLPTALHETVMRELFTRIIGAPDSLKIVYFLHLMVWPWMILISLAICFELINKRLSALEITAMVLLSLLAEPLIAFTLYFCAMHSLRHLLRSQRYCGASVGKLMLVALGPMAGVAVMALAGWVYLPQVPGDARLLQIVFVLLAALTLPHMLLIHRVRYPQ